jgi:hypothetical protein
MGILESVPAPELEAVENRTRFAHFQFDKMGKGRRYSDIVVIKGSFDLVAERIELASVQSPVVLSDEWWPADASDTASLQAAGDLVLHKPATDLLITGSARRSPADGPFPWTTGFVVRDTQRIYLNHQLELIGPRHWEHRRLGGWVLSPAAPTHEVDLRYELAYGGAYIDPKSLLLDDEPQWIKHEANPSGLGFHNPAALDKLRTYPAPQIQHPKDRVKEMNRPVRLAGTGPVCRSWASRTRYAGTYDVRWHAQYQQALQAGQAPDYPADFDEQFFQCAAPDMICQGHLRGHEQIGLGQLLADAPVFFTRLPGLAIEARAEMGPAAGSSTRAVLDTVHIDLDARQVHLGWRLRLTQPHGVRGLTLYAVPVA